MIKNKLQNLIKSNREAVFNVIAAVILVIGGYIFWWLSSGHDVDKAFFYFAKFISIFFFLGSIVMIVETLPDNNLKKWLFWLTGIPMAIAILFIEVFRVLSVTILAFGILLIVQEIVWQIAILFLPTYFINLDLKVYLMFVISLILLAYWGPHLLYRISKIIPDSDHPEKTVKPKLRWFLNKINFRRRAYEIAILVLVVASIENFINTSLFSMSTWSSLKEIALEAFITFLAIDRYIVNFLPKLLKRNTISKEETPNRVGGSTQD